MTRSHITVTSSEPDKRHPAPAPGRPQGLDAQHYARLGLYRVLSLAYLYPKDLDWEEYVEILPSVLEEDTRILVIDVSDEINILARHIRNMDTEQILVEHTALFINNPLKDPVSPYESVYLEGTVMGTSTLQLQELYEQYGLSVSEKHSYLLADHIALELDFMAILIEKSIEKHDTSMTEQRGFFSNHLGRWAWRFFQDVKKNTNIPYFLSLATTAERFLQYEERLLCRQD